MAKTALVDYYKVDQTENNVMLDITIGYGQIAATTVMLNNLKLGDFTNSFSITLGTNLQLKDKELFITTIVHDINPTTNNTSVTISLTGGPLTYVSKMDITVAGNGAIASYSADIEFYS